jgi:3-oxoacyl-[acyl-carrier protein] reductase
MDLGLEGKVALVLGAAGGLGGAIATSLAAEGAHIAFADIDATALRGVEAGLRQSGWKALAVPFDLADDAAMNASVSSVEAVFGEIDVLVNITGGPPATPAAGQERAKWAENFQTMVLSVIALTDRVLPGMRRRKWGRIITSTSSGVVSPIPNLAISNALRLSLVGWSKTLAREVGGTASRRTSSCQGGSRPIASTISMGRRLSARIARSRKLLLKALRAFRSAAMANLLNMPMS